MLSINATIPEFFLPTLRDVSIQVRASFVAIVRTTGYSLVYSYNACYWWCRRLGGGGVTSILSDEGLRWGQRRGGVIPLH